MKFTGSMLEKAMGRCKWPYTRKTKWLKQCHLGSLSVGFPMYRDSVLGSFPCVPLKMTSCSYSLQFLKKRNPLYLNSSNQSQRSFYRLSLFHEPTQTMGIE